jgi:hypothetical protein
MRSYLCLVFTAILLTNSRAPAGDLTFHSGPAQVHLLELFTSEGCSSCPPAEARLSGLKDSPGLWKQIVPISFHVDYWDSLGWPDRFASPTYTERQRTYAAEWGSDSVYTPEFVLDGREFTGTAIPSPSSRGGDLSVVLDSARHVTVHYQSPAPSHDTHWEAHIAMLGAGLETNVRGGENGGRRLRHDFVALGLLSLPLRPGTDSAVVTLPPQKEGEKAIAVWITQAGQTTPMQSAGSWE